jgi:hypothetical protein
MPPAPRTTFSVALAASLAASAVGAQGGTPTIPDLRNAREITIVNDWRGYSPLSPVTSTTTLARQPGGFAGTARHQAGARGVTREATQPRVWLPDSAAARFLAGLTQTPLRPGPYEPRRTHTDDFPSLRVTVRLDAGVVEFTSRSQGEQHIPWRVAVNGAEAVTDSPTVWRALESIRAQVPWDGDPRLFAAVQANPEAECVNGGFPDDPEPGRRFYAGAQPWFTSGEPIVFAGRTYRKYGLSRTVSIAELKRIGQYRNADVFAAGTDPEPSHDVIYLQVSTRCTVQAYRDVSTLAGSPEKPR